MLAAFALLLFQAAPAAQSPAPQVTEMRAACAEFFAASGTVGMTVAALIDGELVFDEAFGERDREAKLPAERGTLIRLASVSKPVTATLAAMLAHEGKLSLDEPMSRHVEGLPLAAQPLTMRRLLSHTAGIRHYNPGAAEKSERSYTTREALALFVGDPLIAQPGSRYSYSTHAFTLVAAGIEGVTERAFRDLVRQRIASACAPTLDCEVASDEKAARSAVYELRDGKAVRAEPREDLSWKHAGGGMESTASDLARFASAVLRAELVPADVRDAMWTQQTLTSGDAVDYGLGWVVVKGRPVVSHTGSQQGSSTMLSVHRDRGIVVAILCNTTGVKASELAPRLQRILGEAMEK